MGTRRRYNREFKVEAVRLVVERRVAVTQAARELNVHANVLRSWVRAYRSDPKQAFPGVGQQAPEAAELTQLRREVARLKMERDILKKATQYTSEAFQRLLHDLGVTCSMSRSGNVWDNSVMESFFSTLKIERCHRQHYATRQAARTDIFDYIERFYNPTRRHSTLGNLSPVAFEQAAAIA